MDDGKKSEGGGRERANRGRKKRPSGEGKGRRKGSSEVEGMADRLDGHWNWKGRSASEWMNWIGWTDGLERAGRNWDQSINVISLEIPRKGISVMKDSLIKKIQK